MPRVARIVMPEVPHHVTQRGNNRQAVFFDDEDRRRYLEFLGEHAKRFGLTIWAYCLMPNHVHLVGVPAGEDSLAQAVGRTNFRYTQHVNRRHGRSGHLWQNRFYSCALDEVHVWRAICYVERNPVRAKMVRVPWRYAWSSAAAHVGESDGGRLLDLAAWRAEWTSQRWRDELRELADEDADRIRLQTHTGRPIGSKSFLARIEQRLRRPVTARPVGRPPSPATKQ